MRIATNAFYERANATMSALTGRANTLQGQIATEKKLAAPSDDAAAYRQLTGIKRAGADAKQDAANVTFAASLLSASDTALAQIETQLQRANELAVRASTGTIDPEQKKMIAAELDAIVEDLMRMANATDSRGQPLFSGASDATPYVRQPDGSIAFAGGGQAGAIPIGDGASIVAATSGENVFGNLSAAGGGTTDVFAVLQGLADRMRSGGEAGDAITDINTALNSVSTARASVGARAARLELEGDRMAENAIDRESIRSSLEDTDIATAITELQKTLTVLQATQASFAKLTELSLFNYLR